MTLNGEKILIELVSFLIQISFVLFDDFFPLFWRNTNRDLFMSSFLNC